MALTRTQIEQISEKLKKMPPAPPAAVNTTKQEAVRLLANDIASLQRRGYTLEQIVASLRGEGLDLTTPTLKSYLARAKAAKGRRHSAPSPSRQAPPSAPSVATKEAPAMPPTDAPTKAGKNAFLVKDKDSY